MARPIQLQPDSIPDLSSRDPLLTVAPPTPPLTGFNCRATVGCQSWPALSFLRSSDACQDIGLVSSGFRIDTMSLIMGKYHITRAEFFLCV